MLYTVRRSAETWESRRAKITDELRENEGRKRGWKKKGLYYSVSEFVRKCSQHFLLFLIFSSLLFFYSHANINSTNATLNLRKKKLLTTLHFEV